jgi:hypothetical protein
MWMGGSLHGDGVLTHPVEWRRFCHAPAIFVQFLYELAANWRQFCDFSNCSKNGVTRFLSLP